MNNMLIFYTNIFVQFWEKLDHWFGKFNFDQIIRDLLDTYVTPLHEVFKWLFLILFLIIFILGVISFIKKTFKLFLVLVIVAAIIIIATKNR